MIVTLRSVRSKVAEIGMLCGGGGNKDDEIQSDGGVRLTIRVAKRKSSELRQTDKLYSRVKCEHVKKHERRL